MAKMTSARIKSKLEAKKDQGQESYLDPTKKPAKAKKGSKPSIPEPGSCTEAANVEAADNNLDGKLPIFKKEVGNQNEAKEIPRVICQN